MEVLNTAQNHGTIRIEKDSKRRNIKYCYKEYDVIKGDFTE